MEVFSHHQIKDIRKAENVLCWKLSLSAVKDLTYMYRRVGPEQWRKIISHVRDKVEDHYWIADNLQEEYKEELIIHFGGESDEVSEEERSNSETDGSISSDGE